MSKVQKNVSIFAFAIVFTFIVMYLMFSAVTASAIGGLLAGSFMAALTLVLGLISFAIAHQRQKNAFAGKQKSSDNMDVHQTRHIEIDLPLELAYDIALESLETLDGDNIPKTTTGIPSKQSLKIHKADSGMGRIEAGLRAKTAGIQDFIDFSRINIQLQRIDSQTTRLEIESRPANPIETHDLGRNTHYVNHLALAIRKASRDYLAEDNLQDNSTGQDAAGEDIQDAARRLRDDSQ